MKNENITNKKIEIELVTGRTIVIPYSEEVLADLELEMTGSKPYISEYKTSTGETITDLDIVRIYYE